MIISLHRIPKGKDSGAWFHESFLRGKPEELKNITRIKTEGKARRDLDVPDFYKMPPLHRKTPECHLTSEVSVADCGIIATNMCTSIDNRPLPRPETQHVHDDINQGFPNSQEEIPSLPIALPLNSSNDFENSYHVVGRNSMPDDESAAIPLSPTFILQKQIIVGSPGVVTSRFPENETQDVGNNLRDVCLPFQFARDRIEPLPFASDAGAIECTNCDEISMFIHHIIDIM